MNKIIIDTYEVFGDLYELIQTEEDKEESLNNNYRKYSSIRNLSNINRMEDLIQEFRQWNVDWMGYTMIHFNKPKSIKDFAEEMSKKYTVIKIKDNE